MPKFEKLDFKYVNKIYSRLLQEDRDREVTIKVGLLRDLIHEIKSQQFRMAKIGAERAQLKKAFKQEETDGNM